MEYLFTECETLIPKHVADELLSKALLKNPERAALAVDFLESLEAQIPDGNDHNSGNVIMRDPNDQPILDAAILYGADILISGDKHFREVEIDKPRIMKPADFIAEFLPDLA